MKLLVLAITSLLLGQQSSASALSADEQNVTLDMNDISCSAPIDAKVGEIVVGQRSERGELLNLAVQYFDSKGNGKLGVFKLTNSVINYGDEGQLLTVNATDQKGSKLVLKIAETTKAHMWVNGNFYGNLDLSCSYTVAE